MNMEFTEKRIVAFIKNYVHKNNFENVVIGISGGLDSAVVAVLCARALGANHVTGLLMPYKTSSKESLTHGKLLCDRFCISYGIIDISPSVDVYFNRFPAEHHLQIPNKCARERMSVLYDFSVRKKALVAGTSNKTEYLIGYCTQYGDGAAAFEPIADLYKTQVFELARHLGIPEEIINKKPSADLWEGQTDEGEIGATYKDMDEILQLYFHEAYTKIKIISLGYPEATVYNIIKRVENSHFKREMPPICKLT